MEAGAVKQIGEYAQDAMMADQRIANIEGYPFFLTQGTIEQIRPKLAMPEKLTGSLRALVTYVGENPDDLDLGTSFVHVVDRKLVRVLGPTMETGQRATFFEATATDYVAQRLGKYMQQDDFVIFLQTHFEMDSVLGQLLALASKVRDDSSITLTDDGITQSVSMAAGVHLKEPRDIPPIVHLFSARGFPEVSEDMPVPYLFRVRRQKGEQTGFALFTADSNQWEVHAQSSVRAFLLEKLGGLIKVVG